MVWVRTSTSPWTSVTNNSSFTMRCVKSPVGSLELETPRFFFPLAAPFSAFCPRSTRSPPMASASSDRGSAIALALGSKSTLIPLVTGRSINSWSHGLHLYTFSMISLAFQRQNTRGKGSVVGVTPNRSDTFAGDERDTGGGDSDGSGGDGFRSFLRSVSQTSAGAVMLTDAVFWLILYPFLTLADYRLNLLDVRLHSINAFYLLGDTISNFLRFPMFRFAYFVLWTGLYVVFQWIFHACVSIWWPYPFLDLSSSYAPLWYLGVAVMHIPCYSIFALIIRLKHILLLRWFPESHQNPK
ncbi:hypothetical protein ACJRO7_012546 [Eucalyptus globulus]|uniref:TLC domain-containing protein n=1 Tax=Eucalyptus globulus TaxID=34317 RepID=A0ABD3LIV3_EUCGL